MGDGVIGRSAMSDTMTDMTCVTAWGRKESVEGRDGRHHGVDIVKKWQSRMIL